MPAFIDSSKKLLNENIKLKQPARNPLCNLVLLKHLATKLILIAQA